MAFMLSQSSQMEKNRPRTLKNEMGAEVSMWEEIRNIGPIYQ